MNMRLIYSSYVSYKKSKAEYANLISPEYHSRYFLMQNFTVESKSGTLHSKQETRSFGGRESGAISKLIMLLQKIHACWFWKAEMLSKSWGSMFLLKSILTIIFPQLELGAPDKQGWYKIFFHHPNSFTLQFKIGSLLETDLLVLLSF